MPIRFPLFLSSVSITAQLRLMALSVIPFLAAPALAQSSGTLLEAYSPVSEAELRNQIV